MATSVYDSSNLLFNQIISEATPYTPVKTKVVVEINDVEFDRWESINVTRGIDNLCGAFSITTFYDYEDAASPFELSGEIAIYHVYKANDSLSTYGEERKSKVVTGFIDEVKTSATGSGVNVEISGRDITCDLVDCTIENTEFLKDKAVDAFQKLIKPFPKISLDTIFATEKKINTIVERKNQSPDAKVADVISEVASKIGVLAISDEQGRLAIEGTGSATLSGDLSLGSDGNILSADHSINHSNRFTSITVLANSDIKIGNMGSGGSESEASRAGSAVSKAPMRFSKRPRPLTIISANNGTDSDFTLQNEADWQMTMSIASVTTINVKTQGWRTNKGELWKINCFVNVDLKKLGLRQSRMLIKSVNFNIGAQGSVTTLELIHEDSYDNKKFDTENGKDDSKIA